MICIHFYGESNTGKTGRISEAVRMLKKEKIKVACLKHLPCEKFLVKETGSKDTNRFAEAGADLIVANTQNELVLWREGGYGLKEFKDIVDEISRRSEIQVLFIEGFKNYHYPGLKDSNDFGKGENAVRNMVDWIAEELRQEKRANSILQKLPGTNCGKCGTSCFELAKKIARGEAKIEDCRSLSSEELKMEVNGMEIKLGSFPRELIANQLKAIARSLKGPDGMKIEEVHKLRLDYRK
jgi:molybdopterin-guanine dinucleotide biosynthesis protein MobB